MNKQKNSRSVRSECFITNFGAAASSHIVLSTDSPEGGKTFSQGLNSLKTTFQPLLINPSIAKALLKRFPRARHKGFTIHITTFCPHNNETLLKTFIF